MYLFTSHESALKKLVALLLLGLFALAAGCLPDSSEPKDDLGRARKAFAESDLGDAEMYFERYLRKNPQGEQRWAVWQQLLSIALDMRRDKATAAEYLEVMLVEYGADSKLRWPLQMKLARLYADMNNTNRAAAIWETLAQESALPVEEKATVYKELAKAYMERLEFTPAMDAIAMCLDLKTTVPDTRADCYNYMSEIHIIMDSLKESEKTLRDLLALEGVSPEKRVLATFTLADVLEQQKKYTEAAELFDSIRESYPNTKVIEIRLGSLRTKIGR